MPKPPVSRRAADFWAKAIQLSATCKEFEEGLQSVHGWFYLYRLYGALGQFRTLGTDAMQDSKLVALLPQETDNTLAEINAVISAVGDAMELCFQDIDTLMPKDNGTWKPITPNRTNGKATMGLTEVTFSPQQTGLLRAHLNTIHTQINTLD